MNTNAFKIQVMQWTVARKVLRVSTNITRPATYTWLEMVGILRAEGDLAPWFPGYEYERV